VTALIADDTIEGLTVEEWMEKAIERTRYQAYRNPFANYLLPEVAGLAGMALAKAIRSFGGNKSAFTTWLTHCIRFELQHWARDKARFVKIPAWRQEADSKGKGARRVYVSTVSLDALVERHYGEDFAADERFEDSLVERIDRTKLMNTMLARLTPIQQQVMVLTFAGFSAREIACRRGCRVSNIYHHRQLAIERMKRMVSREDNTAWQN
jgi:RNA polymerase sigma factor (sigma-70 family)